MTNDSLIDHDDPPTAVESVAVRRARAPKAVLITIAAVLLLAAAIGGVMLWSRDGDADAPGTASATASYVEAPAMVVNLRGGDGRTHFLKLRFIIVASSPAGKTRITERMPVVVDALQSFLRELRPEDLTGSAAVFRVKEEMMIRAQAALGKGSVNDILIQDLVEQ